MFAMAQVPAFLFLAVELEGRVGLFPGGLHFPVQRQLALDEQAGGAAGGIVDAHAGLRVHDERHDLAHLAGGVELARALPAALGELADEVFVAAPDDVALDVGQPEPLGADGLDEVAQAGVVKVALAVGGGVEVDAVDDPLEQRVGVGDGAEMGGELLADLVRERADDGPDGVVGVLRLQREEEADELLVVLDELEPLGARADFLGDAVDLVIEHVAEALGEDEREDELLVFRRVLGAADGTGGVPDPGFERFVAILTVGHRQLAHSLFDRSCA